VWRWLVLVAILLSMHETAPLEPLGAATARLLGRWTGFEDPRWWTLGVAACWGLLTARTLFEMRRCVLASLMLATAAAALIAGPAIAGALTPGLPGAQSVMLTGGLRLVGHLCLLSAVALYARHVILEAEGLVKSRARKRPRGEKSKRRVKATADDDAEPGIASPTGGAAKPRVAGPPRTDLETGKASAQSAGQPSAQSSTQARPVTAARSDFADRQPPRPHSLERREPAGDEDDQRDSSGLTRAERKKLKRQQRQAS
jgi:hypothetical protein